MEPELQVHIPCLPQALKHRVSVGKSQPSLRPQSSPLYNGEDHSHWLSGDSGLNESDDRKAPQKPAAFSPSSTPAPPGMPQPVWVPPAGHVWSFCPPIAGWKGQRALPLPCAVCSLQRSHCTSLNRRLCLAAIILFPAAAASPPFLNWEYSAAFSSAGSAISDPYEASRSHNLGNTQQGAGDIA